MSLSHNSIGWRLATLRKHRGLSQKDLADQLELSRSSLTQIEVGGRNLSVIELSKFAKILKFSYNKFLAEDFVLEDDLESKPKEEFDNDSEDTLPRLQLAKCKYILLFLLEKCAGKTNVDLQFLHLLLYHADFNYFEIYQDYLTGAIYRKSELGPEMNLLDSVIESMVESEMISQVQSVDGELGVPRYLPLNPPNLTKLMASETEIIDKVLNRFGNWNWKSLVNYTMDDIPVQNANIGAVIQYEDVKGRSLPYTTMG